MQRDQDSTAAGFAVTRSADLTRLQRYGLGVAVSVVMVLLRMALTPWLEERAPFAMFAVGLLLAAWVGGRGAGMLATFLTGITGWYLFLGAPEAFTQLNVQEVLQLVQFLVTGVCISLIGGSLRTSNLNLRSVLGTLQSTQKELEVSRQRLATLAQSVPAILFITDDAGSSRFASKQFRDFTGYPSHELLETKWMQVVHPEDRQALQAAWRRSAAEGNEHLSTFRMRRYDGEYCWFQCRAAAIPAASGEGREWFAVCSDIHELKRMEGQLAERTHALTRSNEDLQQFAHIASHDLQEPLRTVGVFTELLVKRNATLLDEESRLAARYILEGVARMRAEVDGLLTLARVKKAETGPRATGDLNHTLALALENLRLAIGESHAEIQSYPLPRVEGNHSLLLQVFQNLISNAIRYRSSETPHITIETKRETGQWVFSVRDNGIGFDMKYADSIFGMFYRLHTKSKVEGTGIGLAVCRRIIEQHGGRIWAESEPGHGSVFYFTLPALAEEARAATS